MILVAPVKSDLFNSRCNCSFRSVPNPGGIPERHPFLMCTRMFSICLNVASVKHEEGTLLHLSIRRSRLASISSGSGVTFSRDSPRSVLCLNINPNSFPNWCLRRDWPVSNVLSTRWHAWKMSNLIWALGKTDWYLFLFLQQSSIANHRYWIFLSTHSLL